MFFFPHGRNVDDYRKSLGKRIAYAVDKAQTKSSAADSVGISVEQLNKWIRGTVKVPAEALGALAAFTGVDFSWLVTGEAAVTAAMRYAGNGNASEMIRLPIYQDIRASAGPGAAVPSERADGVISFDPRFLRDQGAVPERCTVIWAHGDSMVPTIPDGSALIVDHSQTEVKNGSIMVIGVGEDLLVKRVRRRLDGLIDLISDNAAYQPETLGPDALQQLRVIGRVVYFCRVP